MEQIYSCIVIDDDPLFLRTMTTYIREINWLSLEGTYDQPIRGATAIVSRQPDIVFLDLDMPYVDGQYLVDWVEPKIEKMNPKPRIIIVSSMDQIPEKLVPKVVGFIKKNAFKDPEGLEKALKAVI